MKVILEAPISDEEIRAEFFSLPTNKSRGPDGYTAEFVEKMWSVIGHELIFAAREFFESGQLLK